MMYGHQQSDPCVVATKPTNKSGSPEAELGERRRGAVGNMVGLHTDRTQGRASVFQRLDRVRQAARQRKKEQILHPWPISALPLCTRSGSPVRESRPPGSVRGMRREVHSYRNH